MAAPVCALGECAMVQVAEERKRLEAELHDQLRGELKDDAHYIANQRFYVISDSNKDYVQRWLLQRAKGKLILDYCCGNGHFSVWMGAHGLRSVGIDISPVSVQDAMQRAAARGLSDYTRFQVADAECLPFPDNSFDYAVVNGVLHHLDLDKSYRELARVLKPEGAVICTEALRHNPLIHWYRKLTPQMRSAWEVDHILGKAEIELGHRYFQNVKLDGFYHLAAIGAVPLRRTPLYPIALPLLRGLDAVLLRLPGVQWMAWMAVFTLANPKKGAR
jgi:ubiquinone/menaquinone biosynthesis C-methylase UbiE